MQTQHTATKVTSSNATQACLAIKLPRVQKSEKNAGENAAQAVQKQAKTSSQSYDFVGIAG